MNKTARAFRTVAIVFLTIAMILALIGTILMFFAEETVYDYSWSSYTYSYRTTTTTVSYAEAGVLPLIGFFCLVIALAFMVISKNSPNSAIGTMVSIFISQAFLYSSVAMIDGQTSDIAWEGYWLCVTAASILALVFLFALLYRIFVKRVPRNEREGEKKVAMSRYARRLYQAADVLRELREMYDGGILTQAEYLRAKKEAIERFDLYPISEPTPYHGE
ncbi:MAG: SHOCT domain-containing protein [Clostridia bacterium]|nr:SHOCT domain-containing protein [Clostridia bacterium]